MGENLSFWEHLTEDAREAKWIWEHIFSSLKRVGRTDILQNLNVLDLGGAWASFLKI